MAIKPPVLGVPPGMKQAGQRVDFRTNHFDLLVETKGYLLAWSRASRCPCTFGIEQSDHSDPNCPLCKGKGWIYFKASEDQDLTGYIINTLQQFIIENNSAVVIRGIMTLLENKQDSLDKISNWVDGTARLTVRPENKLGYLDRIVGLDCLIVYNENVKASGTSIIASRYPIVEINQIRSFDTVFSLDTDYEINDQGQIHWLETPPIVNTVLSIHYLCHPTWLIVNHPHASRVTPVLMKTPTPKTPTGNPIDLVTKAIVAYEFLVEV